MFPETVKILLIEDNPGDARLIREMLAAEGERSFEIEWVTRLSDGLARLGRDGIDLVLLDLGLPDSQGIDTFIQAAWQNPQVPFVVLTGLADETVGVTAVRQGAQDYLIKGEVEGSLLLRAIRYATERKRVEEALKESEKNLRYLASQLLNAQEKERKRISRDLHDGLGGSLLSMRLQIKAIEKKLAAETEEIKTECDLILSSLEELIDKVRRLSRDLSPAILEDLGLTSALRHLFSDFAKHSQTGRCSLEIDAIEDLFSTEERINIYRIFQEALTNIGKYAQASRISGTVRRRENEVSFLIEDNGRGFDVPQALAAEATDRGLGLAAMEERVRMLGGELYLWSEEGKGTRISFTIPLANKPRNPIAKD